MQASKNRRWKAAIHEVGYCAELSTTQFASGKKMQHTIEM